MSAVVAGSASDTVEVTFYDRNGQETVPSEVTYRILGKELGKAWQEVRALTPLAVATVSVEIPLTSDDTALLGTGPLEKRRLCVFVDQVLQSAVDFDVVAASCDVVV